MDKPNKSNSRPSVMLFISALKTGGAERVACNLANNWLRHGHEVALITIAPPSSDDYELHNNVKRESLNLLVESGGIIVALINNIKRVFILRHKIRQHRPDVLLAFMTSSNILAIIAALGTPTRVIVSERINPAYGDSAGYWLHLRRYLYRFSYHVVVLAEDSRRWIIKHTKSRRVSVIPNMLIWPLPEHKGALLPPQTSDHEKILLAAGRLAPQKNYPLLIRSFNRVAKDFNDWQLYIAGAGDPTDLMRLCEQLGIPHRVHSVSYTHLTLPTIYSV